MDNIFQYENNALIKSYLDRTFFKTWKMPIEDRIRMRWPLNYNSLELFLNATCELNCKYCYISKFGKNFFKPGSQDIQKILLNLKMLLDWLYKNNMTPNLEIFGGNVFSSNLGRDVIDKILEYMRNGKKCATGLVIPCNMNFINDSKKLKITEDQIQIGKQCGFRIAYSISIDGLYMDQNRPLKNNSINHRDNDFYEKIFEFASKYEFGFHPMIYSDGIDKWKDNFLWFQSMYEKYNISWTNLYLLEVRNAEWTVEQCSSLYKFIKFIIKWSWDKCEHNEERYIDFLFKDRGFNLLSSVFTRHGRGIGCSLQSSIQLKVGELTSCICHRQAYSWMDGFKFVDDGEKIIDIEAIHPESYIVSHTFSNASAPWCETCRIKNLCQGGCMGSQYESTGDNYTPIPTTCLMEHAKIKAIIDANNEIKMLPKIISLMNEDKIHDIEFILGE